jgi:hypothetical protein
MIVVFSCCFYQIEIFVLVFITPALVLLPACRQAGHRPLRRTLVLPVRYSSMLRPYGALSLFHCSSTGL